jgi:tetratricopeptide (TPR) repeat protein
MIRTMGAHFERARYLFEQSRFDQAEQELRNELALAPDDPVALALLGLCLAATGRGDPLECIETALRLDPNLAFAHYARADVLHDRDDLAGARSAVGEALRLDPTAPNYFALLSGVELKEGRWPAALAAAERGLAVDPDHVGCGNLRGLSLLKLNRPAEAADALRAVLARDPDNAVSHAHLGWATLHLGDAVGALRCFREALRLDADFDEAREGVLASLRARLPIYPLLLRGVLLLKRLGRGHQLGLLAVGLTAYWVLEALSLRVPEAGRYLGPLLGCTVALAVVLWIADPLFNLVLRFDSAVRRSLTKDQLRASTGVGLCLLAAAVPLGIWLSGGPQVALWAAGAGAVLTVPVAGTFERPPGRGRGWMAGYTAATAAAAYGGLALLAVTGRGLLLFLPGVVGALVSGWVVLLLGAFRPSGPRDGRTP